METYAEVRGVHEEWNSVSNEVVEEADIMPIDLFTKLSLKSLRKLAFTGENKPFNVSTTQKWLI
jgi:hypothetical protein